MVEELNPYLIKQIRKILNEREEEDWTDELFEEEGDTNAIDCK